MVIGVFASPVFPVYIFFRWFPKLLLLRVMMLYIKLKALFLIPSHLIFFSAHKLDTDTSFSEEAICVYSPMREIVHLVN